MEEKPITDIENFLDPNNLASKPFKFALHFPQRSSATSKPLTPDHIKPQENLQYITEFDPNKPAAKTIKIIPRLQNSWLSHSSLSKFEGGVHSPRFKPETNCSANSAEDESLRKLRADIELCPGEVSLDEYETMPVEEFGEALLRGMGWSHGKGIGLNAKGPIAPYEPLEGSVDWDLEPFLKNPLFLRVSVEYFRKPETLTLYESFKCHMKADDMCRLLQGIF